MFEQRIWFKTFQLLNLHTNYAKLLKHEILGFQVEIPIIENRQDR